MEEHPNINENKCPINKIIKYIEYKSCRKIEKNKVSGLVFSDVLLVDDKWCV